jgi:DNA-binding PucR family transcriptional regulator
VIALTLLRYLDSGGQVAVTAARLGVHVTTVRYRLRGASEASGLDLEDADDRLAAQLILRFASRAGQIKA